MPRCGHGKESDTPTAKQVPALIDLFCEYTPKAQIEAHGSPYSAGAGALSACGLMFAVVAVVALAIFS